MLILDHGDVPFNEESDSVAVLILSRTRDVTKGKKKRAGPVQWKSGDLPGPVVCE